MEIEYSGADLAGTTRLVKIMAIMATLRITSPRVIREPKYRSLQNNFLIRRWNLGENSCSSI